MKNKTKNLSGWLFLLLSIALCCFATYALADEQSIGDVAKNVTGSFQDIGKLMIATAYLAGFGFLVASVFKFKQHKDNPTQIPMGTPIALLVIGIILVFLPSIVGPAGKTVFKSPTYGGFTGEGAEKIGK